MRYTNIYTACDELVRPVWNATRRHGAQNVEVQDQCGARVVGRVGLTLDDAVYGGIRDDLRGDRVRLNCWAL